MWPGGTGEGGEEVQDEGSMRYRKRLPGCSKRGGKEVQDEIVRRYRMRWQGGTG